MQRHQWPAIEPTQSLSGHEDAERVPGRIGEDVKRFVLVVGSVENQSRAEAVGTLSLLFKVIPIPDREIEVELHGHCGIGPRTPFESLGLLEGDLPPPCSVCQHQPVIVIGVSAFRRLVTRAIDIAEQLPIELGEFSRFGCVDDGVQQVGIVAGAGLLPRVVDRHRGEHGDLPPAIALHELIHVPLVRGTAVIPPSDIGPDAVPGRCRHGDGGIDLRDSFVLSESLREELLGLPRPGDENPLPRELDERRHRIVIGDRHGIPIEQRTSVGIEELSVNLFVLIHAADATPRS